jgi:hypothetical protein
MTRSEILSANYLLWSFHLLPPVYSFLLFYRSLCFHRKEVDYVSYNDWTTRNTRRSITHRYDVRSGILSCCCSNTRWCQDINRWSIDSFHREWAWWSRRKRCPGINRSKPVCRWYWSYSKWRWQWTGKHIEPLSPWYGSRTTVDCEGRNSPGASDSTRQAWAATRSSRQHASQGQRHGTRKRCTTSSDWSQLTPGCKHCEEVSERRSGIAWSHSRRQ